MLWGAFSAVGKLELQFTSSRMKSSDYINVLRMSLLPYVGNSARQWTFQRDNARIHTSRETKTWLSDNNIEVMEWPACSSDLNPIENLWGILVRTVYRENRQYDNVEQLKASIINAYDAIEMSLLARLAGSMPSRIFDVIKNKGNYRK